MNKLLLASVAVLGFAGAAAAQEAPALIYSDAFAQNVQNVGSGTVDGFASASAAALQNATITGVGGFQINDSQNYSGR
jgi:outer membrane lipoprotein SlyB